MYILRMDNWAEIKQERLLLADQLDTFSAEAWNTPSLCGDWTVREVVAHLIVPHKTTIFGFIREMVKAGGSFDKVNTKLARREAERSNSELIEDLRSFADGRFTPPGFGSEAPLTDVMIHIQDIFIPLGLSSPSPLEHWSPVLDLLVSKKARKAFVHGKVPDVHLVASDLNWSHGAGSDVRGSGAAIALTLSGRSALTTTLEGPGAKEFVEAMIKE
jgi:uncharacterized protein (TIGR03083 family)